jgi:hypothetical protein
LLAVSTICALWNGLSFHVHSNKFNTITESQEHFKMDQSRGENDQDDTASNMGEEMDERSGEVGEEEGGKVEGMVDEEEDSNSQPPLSAKDDEVL